MSKSGFELNLAGLNELMKSPEMQEVLRKKGAEVAGRAGSDYDSSVHVASYVAIANVWPNSKEAAEDNYKNNTLLKALGGSG